MFSDVHTEFILTPLTEILSDGVNACSPMPTGIESSALAEYFLQSLFLRMTGAQEQKLKCICWVMASNDYRYRYELLNMKQYGECSDYKDKLSIYRDMVLITRKQEAGFMPVSVLDDVEVPEERVAELDSQWKYRVNRNREKQVREIIAKQEAKKGPLRDVAKEKIRENLMRKPYPQADWENMLNKERKARLVNDIVARLIAVMGESPLTTWRHREYLYFKENYWDVLNVKQLKLSEKDFLDAKLQKDYEEIVFEHRNRTAHNTASYLKDVPTLDVLADKGQVYKSYFFRFAILMLIDEIFVRMFKKYRESC